MNKASSVQSIWIGSVLVLFAAVFGIRVHGDYGVPWDEPHQRRLGAATYDYIRGENDVYLSLVNREYGAVYELALHMAERTFAHDELSAYRLRHLANHLIFIAGAAFLYALVLNSSGSVGFAVLAFLLMMLHPRLYADSFYNTKDIPFMAAQPVCYWLFFRVLHEPRWPGFLMLGAAVGTQMALRIMGALPAAVIAMLIAIMAWRGPSSARFARGLLIFALMVPLTTYLAWPYLWTNPIENFHTAFVVMSKYPWGGTVLFAGQLIPAKLEPWYYSLTWFIITLPPMAAIVAVASIVAVGRTCRSWMREFPSPRTALLLLAMLGLSAPFVSVIMLHSVLYDGWRHLFFVYPAFVLFITVTCAELAGCHIILILGFIATAWSGLFLYSAHPHQNVYFNRLAGPSDPQFLRTHWDLDYWGLSFKQALRYIVSHDTSPVIRICASNVALGNNTYLLSPADRARLQFVVFEDADYFVTNYRDHPDDYKLPATKLVFERIVLGSRIVAVYRLR